MANPLATNVKVKRPKRSNKNIRKLNVSAKNVVSDEHKQWYDLPEEKIGNAIQQVISIIDNNNYDLRERFMRYARLYGNYESLGWVALSNVNRSETSNNRPVFNVIQSGIDTLMSKMVKDNPTPYFITSGADYFEKLKAEKMTQFVQGIFQEGKLYDIANNQVFRDAAVYGLGGMQFWYNKKKAKIEYDWVFIDELKVDKYDGNKREPRSMHRCKMVSKEMLVAEFPDKEDILNELATTHPDYFRSQDTVIDLIVRTESWHLCNDQKKGRHTITVLDEVLLDEDYEEDWFPFSFFRYMTKPNGFWGRSVTETCLSGQVEINKILMFIQQCQELQASPVIMVDNMSDVAEDVILMNNVARMIPYRSGTNPPQFVTPTACAPEIYEHLKWWIQSCYQEIGVSQTSASGEKQPGITSAIALRTMVDIESSRYIQASKAWEQFYVDGAEICVKLGKIAYKHNSKFKVNYTDKKSKIIKEIPWDKIDMPDDMYVIKCDTISGFPASAAGRIQTITDFISQQFISKERGMELLNLDPDLEGEVKLQTSSLRYCEKALCSMVEDGIYIHPEKYLNLKLMLTVSEQTYAQLLIDSCPEERLQLVRQWMDELAMMLGAPDPQLALLQQLFSPNAPAPVAAQAGLQAAGAQPQ